MFVEDGQEVSVGDPLLTVQAKGLTSQISALRNRLELLDLEYRSIQTIIDSPSLESLLPLPPLPQVDDSDFYADMIAARNQTYS